MTTWAAVERALREQGRAALVTVTEARGSSPREPGARMVVRPDGCFSGTIGGGALEWTALAEAKALLQANGAPAMRMLDVALGPDLGQCCGGRVSLSIERFDISTLPDVENFAQAERNQEQRTPLLLFGAGHVGRALVRALAPLPFKVTWIDSRHGAFDDAPQGIATVLTDEPLGMLAQASDGAFILVMTYSHALDLDLVMEALRAERFAYVGLIGSETKRARFVAAMGKGGLAPSQVARLICPIGVPGIGDKSPAAIAASTAAQLLMVREQVKSG